MKRSILVLLAGAVLATSAYADILVSPLWLDRLDTGHGVQISNIITRSDYNTLVEKVTEIQKDKSRTHKFFYFLDSNGGDVDTALKIGRFLRANKANVSVSTGSICYSSCVFVLAGATMRSTLGGKIGIHRPYEPDDTIISANAQKAKYAKMGDTIKSYLSEMNIKPQLYDDMLYISPLDVRILSKSELQSYGLAGDDPFEHAAAIAKKAKKHGISVQELMKRVERANAECGSAIPDGELSLLEHITKWQSCRNDIFDGRR